MAHLLNQLNNKHMKRFLYSFASILLFFSCTKESNNLQTESIIGLWISEDRSDTLDFVDDSTFYKSSDTLRYDHFDYKLSADTIEIGYSGSLYIHVTPTSHAYYLSDNKLTIDFSNIPCYGFGSGLMSYIKMNLLPNTYK